MSAPADLLASIAARLAAARATTLRLVEGLDDDALAAQPDPGFSPVGWHLGHIGFTEATWLLERCCRDDRLSAPMAQAFAQDGRPKAERTALPSRAELLGYLAAVRARSLDALATLAPRLADDAADPLLRGGYVARFVEHHEHQHRETIAIVLQAAARARTPETPPPATGLRETPPPARVPIAAGEVAMGGEVPDAVLVYDNELPGRRAACAAFALDAAPATCAEWQRFMAETGARAPLGWFRGDDGGAWRARLGGPHPIDGREPVTGISWFEAETYCRWREGRLPSEAEWERAARSVGGPAGALGLATDGPVPVAAVPGRLSSLLGGVWEWTASPFEPYAGFRAFPYAGYSAPYFDGAHRVLRGGSFATNPAIARPGFRNWYPPETRAIFGGVRVAYDP